MQKKGNGRKSLIIGIVAAVAILAALLAVLLTQCTGGIAGTTATTTAAVETTELEIPSYNLYWNADRAEYEGKSAAGLSSRKPEADGYYHIRFILDGQEVVLKTADNKVMNAIDVRTLMDLEFDENGYITGVIDILDMPIQRLGWMFFVQSAAKNLIKLNSADGMNGIEVLLELTENSAVYDMSGETGPLGTKAEVINMDRVYAIGNLAGEVTHIFIYERPNYMLSHEAECEHCKKVVTWKEWPKDDEMPTATGHYQLQNDVKVSKQPKQEEDSDICIDLNGYRVDAAPGVRCYAMWNPATELAIMDTSEAQTGTLAPHGEGGNGMAVWVRYGAFYLYGGTLDASDIVCTGNGPAVEVRSGAYFYMHGGTIIGGTTTYLPKETGGYTAGLGGAVVVAGKFVMNDGEIRDGCAKAVVTAYNEDGTPKSFQRGLGGNVMLGGGSEMVMNGGTIKNGRSGNNGGNIYMDSRAVLTINGGTISGGRTTNNGRSGGNIYVGNKATLNINGGVITGGTAYAEGGNVRSKGTIVMTAGYITNGRVRDYATGEVKENASGANIRCQDGSMYMYGGTVKGGMTMIDSAKNDNIRVKLRLSGSATIYGGEGCTRNLTISTNGDGVTVNVDKMRSTAKIGVYTTGGYFTDPTAEENKDKVFLSDIEGAEVVYHDGRLALGKVGCVCGRHDGHIGECDGAVKLWAPWTTTTSLPKSTGYWYLISDLDELPKQTNVTNTEPQQVYLNLNGHSATVPTGTGRVYRISESNLLVITDHEGTGGLYSKGMANDVGSVIFQQTKTSHVQLYGGTLAMTADCVMNTKSGGVVRTSGTFDMFGGTISGGKAEEGGNIMLQTGSTMNMFGGEVKGGTGANGSGSSHSNIYVYNATFNMSGGTVYGIRATNSIENGCSINISGSARILTGKDGHAFRMTVKNDSLTAEHRPMIEVGELNDDAKIIISGVSGYVTTATDKANTKYFASAANEQISYEDGRVYIGMQACVCGSKTDEHIGDCDGTKQHWTAWTKTDSLPTETGYWYLTRDLTPTTFKKQTGLTDTTAQQVYLNLNGYSVTGAARVYRISESNLLAITDHKGGGGLYGGGLSADNGGTILQQNSTSVIKMYGGTLGMGGEAVTDTAQGGVLRTNGSFYLYGGEITGGQAAQGGNIHLHSGSNFYLDGGCVSDGTATGNGGNISITNGTLHMLKGTVTGGTATNGGNIYSDGTVEMVGGDVKLGVASADGGNLYINEDSVKCAITGGTISEGKATVAGGNLRVHKAKVSITGITVSGGEAAMGNNIYQAGSASAVTLTNAVIDNTVTGSDNVYVRAGNLNIEGTTELKTIDGSRNINTSDEGSGIVNLKSGTITGAEFDGNGANIWLSARATLKVTGGTITGGTATGNGGNLYLSADGAKVTMTGGTITGGSAVSGGNISQDGGTFNFYSGTISDGTASANGGNIHVVAGAFNAAPEAADSTAARTISGGVAGSADSDTIVQGGNIYADRNAVVLLAGENTLISDGTAVSTDWAPGGNIRVDGTGDFQIINGAKVTGGSAEEGNNIYISRSASKVTLDGAVIENTVSSGSSIHAKAGQLKIANTVLSTVDGARNIMTQDDGRVTITISGTSTVTGAKVSGDGANIWISELATLDVFGGTITGGDALSKSGGNIYSNGGFVNILGGTVKDGKAGQGGNIALNNASVSTISGGTVTGGQAANGGNISVVKSALTANGGTVTGGSASTAGNNLYISGSASVVTLSGVKLENTVADKENLLFRDGDLTISGGSLTTVDGSRNINAEKAGIIKITGGSVVGASFIGDGANILMTTTSKLAISGGTVSGSDSGNIYSSSTGYVSISGGTVSGGNVHVAAGTLKVSGNATVKDGANGNNVTLGDGTALELSGGTVAGGIKLGQNVSVKISGAPTVDPALTETGAKPAFGIDLVNGTANTVVNASGMTGGKVVVKAVLGQFAENATSDMTRFFHSGDPAYVVSYADGALHIALPIVKSDCVCGTTTDEHVSYTVDGVTYGCTGTELEWTDFTPTAEKPLPTDAGNYRLTGDVTVSNATTLSAAVVLDLNGHTVTVENGRMYTMAAGAELTITNTEPGKGGIVAAAAEGKTIMAGAVAEVASGTTLNIYNINATMAEGTSVTENGGLFLVKGTMNIYGNTQISGGKTAKSGGNIYVDSNAVLNMYDGVVTKGEGVSGGNIGTERGTLNLYGGAVTTGQASNGGNIWNSKATLNARAVTISGGGCTGHGNNIYITGGASRVYLTGTNVNNTVGNNEDNITYRAGVFEIKNANLTSVDDDYNIFCEDTTANSAILLNNVTFVNGGIYLTADKSIAVAGAMPSGSSVSLDYAVNSITEPVAFATGSSYTIPYAAKSWFTSADGYQIGLMDGKLHLVPAGTHIHCVCGGTLRDGQTFADGTAHTCEDIIYQALEVEGDENKLTWSVTESVNWYLAEDLALTGQGGSGGFDVKLCLNGHSLHNSSSAHRLFNTTNGGSVIVGTCKPGANGDNANRLISSGERNHNGGIMQMNHNNSVFETYGITLDATDFVVNNNAGVIDAYKGTVRLYNTVVYGATIKSGSDYNGSIFRITNTCPVYVYGGRINGNGNALDGDSDILIRDGAELHLIGNVSITGKSGITNVETEGTGKVNVTYLTGLNAPLSVKTAGNPFTAGWHEDWTISDYFVSAMAEKAVALNTESKELELVAAP